MGVKTITIDLEAYKLLAREKRKGESFSMVIKRRVRPERTARVLREKLPKLALAEDTLDALEDIVRHRSERLADSPALDPEG